MSKAIILLYRKKCNQNKAVKTRLAWQRHDDFTMFPEKNLGLGGHSLNGAL